MTDIIVQRTRIIGTAWVVYSAWEPTAIRAVRGGHSMITTIDDKPGWYGRVGTADVPAAIDVLPVGPERWAALEQWRASEYRRAYDAIQEAYPHLNHRSPGDRLDMGQIEELLVEERV